MATKDRVDEQQPSARAALSRLVARARRGLLPLLVVALFAWPFPHFEILRSPNELARLYQARAIVDDHSLTVNGPVARDGTVGDLSEVDGRLYPNKAPGMSFLGALVYAVVRALSGGAEHVSNRGLLYVLRLFGGVIPTLLVLRPLRRYAARVSGDAQAAEAAVLTFAFGSLAFTYSLLFFSHQLAAVLAIGAFLALERAKESPRAGALQLVGGLLAGYAVVTEYTVAPVAAALAIYGVATARERGSAVVRIGLGALPCVVLLAWYHTVAFGSPLATGYEFVQNRTFAGWHAQGFMGVSTPRITSLAGNLFSASRGLFAFSPALLAAFAGLGLFLREARADAAVALAVVAFYLLLAASFLYEAWGWMLGPRHLAPMVPFLVAPLALVLARFRRAAPTAVGSRFGLGAVAGLCASSMLVTGVCTAVYPHIPEEFSGAVAHLVWPLLRGGHLPYNLGEVTLGRLAPWTWIAWFSGLAVILAVVVVAAIGRLRPVPLAAATLAAGVHVAVLFLAVPPETSHERETRAWILEHWEPVEENVRRGLF